MLFRSELATSLSILVRLGASEGRSDAYVECTPDDQASSPCPFLTEDLRCHLSSLRYISTDRYHIVVEVIMWMSTYVEMGNSYDEQKGKSSDQ